MTTPLQAKIETTYYPAQEVWQKHALVYQQSLSNSKNFTRPNFTSISARDLEHMFRMYDEMFLGNLCENHLRATKAQLSFRVSSRMTSAGGKTTHRIKRSLLKTEHSFEIAVSVPLLFQTFQDVDRPIQVAGLECKDRLEALQRIMEHEIIHLLEMVVYQKSSCSAPRFSSLAKNLFAHEGTRHALITQRERAKEKYGITIGDEVRFEFNGKKMQGVVNRIQKRATILVKDRSGELFSDGKRYTRYYVPLPMLKIA